jgi:NAD(P)H-dependent FMN reductase
MQILTISGSLRSAASNTRLLQAAAMIAPAGVEITLYDELGALPHFNPDLDTPGGDTLPPIVANLRSRVGDAAGVLISSPEYAHGIPGSLKNALDWLVGSTEFPGKPVALLNTSTMSVHAPAQLIEVLTTMNALVVPDACVTVPLRGRNIDAASIAADAEQSAGLQTALNAFVTAITSRAHTMPASVDVV